MDGEFSVARLTNVVWSAEFIAEPTTLLSTELTAAELAASLPTELTVTFPGSTPEQALRTVSEGAGLVIESADVAITPAPAQTDDILHLHGRFYQRLESYTTQAANISVIEGSNGFFLKVETGIYLFTLDLEPIASFQRNPRIGNYLSPVTARTVGGELRNNSKLKSTTNQYVGTGFLSFGDGIDVTRYAVQHYFAKEIEALRARHWGLSEEAVAETAGH